MGEVLRDEKAAELKRCKNFDEILTLVKNSRVPGFGQLAIYDTALRIGHCTGKLPEKVYLHAGTRVGARFYKIAHANEDYILPEELPKELQDMPPHDVEDFLCIYEKGEYRFS